MNTVGPPVKYSNISSPHYGEGNCISQLTFNYLYPYIKLAKDRSKQKDSLKFQDYPSIPPRCMATTNFQKLKNIYERHSSLIKSIFILNWCNSVLMFFLIVIKHATSYLCPFILKKILVTFESQVIVPFKMYMVYSLMMFGSFAINTFSMQHLFLINDKSFALTSSALQSLILNKVFKLSLSSKNLCTHGKIINLMTMDAMSVASFMNFNELITTPVSLMLSSYFLWREVGVCMLPSLVIVILGAYFQYIFGNKLKLLSKEINILSDLKTKKINEVITHIRIIKYNAWESYAVKSIEEIRKKELSTFFKCRMLAGISECVFNMIPMLMLLSILIMVSLAEQKISISLIYTLIIFIEGIAVYV